MITVREDHPLVGTEYNGSIVQKVIEQRELRPGGIIKESIEIQVKNGMRFFERRWVHPDEPKARTKTKPEPKAKTKTKREPEPQPEPQPQPPRSKRKSLPERLRPTTTRTTKRASSQPEMPRAWWSEPTETEPEAAPVRERKGKRPSLSQSAQPSLRSIKKVLQKPLQNHPTTAARTNSRKSPSSRNLLQRLSVRRSLEKVDSNLGLNLNEELETPSIDSEREEQANHPSPAPTSTSTRKSPSSRNLLRRLSVRRSLEKVDSNLGPTLNENLETPSIDLEREENANHPFPAPTSTRKSPSSRNLLRRLSVRRSPEKVDSNIGLSPNEDLKTSSFDSEGGDHASQPSPVPTRSKRSSSRNLTRRLSVRRSLEKVDSNRGQTSNEDLDTPSFHSEGGGHGNQPSPVPRSKAPSSRNLLRRLSVRRSLEKADSNLGLTPDQANEPSPVPMSKPSSSRNLTRRLSKRRSLEKVDSTRGQTLNEDLETPTSPVSTRKPSSYRNRLSVRQSLTKATETVPTIYLASDRTKTGPNRSFDSISSSMHDAGSRSSATSVTLRCDRSNVGDDMEEENSAGHEKTVTNKTKETRIPLLFMDRTEEFERPNSNTESVTSSSDQDTIQNSSDHLDGKKSSCNEQIIATRISSHSSDRSEKLNGRNNKAESDNSSSDEFTETRQNNICNAADAPDDDSNTSHEQIRSTRTSLISIDKSGESDRSNNNTGSSSSSVGESEVESNNDVFETSQDHFSSKTAIDDERSSKPSSLYLPHGSLRSSVWSEASSSDRRLSESISHGTWDAISFGTWEGSGTSFTAETAFASPRLSEEPESSLLPPPQNSKEHEPDTNDENMKLLLSIVESSTNTPTRSKSRSRRNSGSKTAERRRSSRSLASPSPRERRGSKSRTKKKARECDDDSKKSSEIKLTRRKSSPLIQTKPLVQADDIGRRTKSLEVGAASSNTENALGESGMDGIDNASKKAKKHESKKKRSKSDKGRTRRFSGSNTITNTPNTETKRKKRSKEELKRIKSARLSSMNISDHKVRGIDEKKKKKSRKTDNHSRDSSTRSKPEHSSVVETHKKKKKHQQVSSKSELQGNEITADPHYGFEKRRNSSRTKQETVNALAPGKDSIEIDKLRNNGRTRRERLSKLLGIHSHIDRSSDFSAPVFDKTSSERNMIEKSFEGNFAFADLTPSQMKPIVDAFERIEFKKGDVIAEQGEPDCFFYVIKDGKVGFHIDGVRVAGGVPGDVFGQLALVYSCDRMTAATAEDNHTALLRLHQSNFMNIRQKQVAHSIETRTALLKNVPMFQDVDETDLTQLSAAMNAHVFHADDNLSKLFRNLPFCLIQHGSVTSFLDGSISGPGYAFGENNIATRGEVFPKIVALTDGVAYTIDRQSFDKAFGDMSRLVQKSRYKSMLSKILAIQGTNPSDHQLDALARRVTDKSFVAGQNVCVRGEPATPSLYIVRKGKIKILREDGTEEIVPAGGCFGQDHFTRDSDLIIRARHNALSIEDSVCGILTVDEYMSVISGASEYTNNNGKKRKRVAFEDLHMHKVLGEGLFGIVWLVTNAKASKSEPFALKIQPIRKKKSEARRRIRREISVMRKLQHPFVVDLINEFDREDSISMLLSLAPGGELFDRIHYRLPNSTLWGSGIGEEEGKFYCGVVADAISFMHVRGYIYRDLKPENILIGADGYPLIADFGFAKYLAGNEKTYTFCGSPNYLPPEIILKNDGHGAGVDHWSLGVLMYEVVDGESPFFHEGLDQVSLFEKICCKHYHPLPKNTYSKAFYDLIHRLLEKNPSKRLGSFREKDILDHFWFSDISLPAMRRKSIAAPWKPSRVELNLTN